MPLGFDHGVGHPQRLLCEAKVPNCRKNKVLKHLDNYYEWPKVANAVIEACRCQRHEDYYEYLTNHPA